MEKNKTGSGSSPLASTAAVVLWLALGIVCTVIGYRVLAGAFWFLFLLCGAALLWGRRAMKGVSLEARCDVSRLFPGESTEIHYTIQNEKLLPLIWLELSQSVPERDCLTPDDTFEPCTVLDSQEEGAEPTAAYRRRFAFLMGYETLTLSSRWTANRRGLYRPSRLRLTSGDGFGLTQREQSGAVEKLPELVVYPKPVAVDVSGFLRSVREQPSAAAGLVENVSILRGLRPYQTTDSWKRINWRMAARQPGELKVNFYETVQPVQVLFVLDGESFCLRGDGFAALEDTLEIMAALIRELFARGIGCGLCLPASRRFPPVTLVPGEERTAAELLYYLAGYDAVDEIRRDKEGLPLDEVVSARFDNTGAAAAAAMAGVTAVFTYEPDTLSPELLRRLGENVRVYSAGILTSRDPELYLLPARQLRKGAAL